MDDRRLGQGVVSVVEALGLKRVVLIGHSIGGPVVLEAARRMPGRVAGLVLVDTLGGLRAEAPRPRRWRRTCRSCRPTTGPRPPPSCRNSLFSASTPEPVKARVLETVLSVPQEIGVAVARSSMTYEPTAGPAAGLRPHSDRSAWMTSTRDARTAGKSDARIAAAARSAAAPAIGSTPGI